VILVYAIIFLVILALLLRRDLGALGRLQYRGGWKLGLVIGGLHFLQANFVLYVPGKTIFQMLLLVLSQLALIFLFILNRHIPGAKLFALGIILNTTVMIANGGWMPITPETYQALGPNRVVELQDRAPNNKSILIPRNETKFWFLADIIPVSVLGRRYAVSIGDLLLILGVAQFLLQGTAKKDTAPTYRPI
jgi:hypothetical protein